MNDFTFNFAEMFEGMAQQQAAQAAWNAQQQPPDTETLRFRICEDVCRRASEQGWRISPQVQQSDGATLHYFDWQHRDGRTLPMDRCYEDRKEAVLRACEFLSSYKFIE